ncbi:phosphoribosylglycinamide formyltransferase [Myxococcota bacterium]|nr:phosphoribosylglycinamide formyltransferase [Myxococcota bacterium]
MTPIGVLVSGRGSNLAALIARTQRDACPFHIACVISDQPGAPALDLARKAEIPAFCHEKTPGRKKRDFERDLVERLRDHDVEVVALAGYMRILGQTLLEAFPGRVLNIHPSLLPAFPGLHAQEQAHTAGVLYAGCTVHLVDAGMDTGPILDQIAFRIPEGLSSDDLSLRILEHEHRLYPETLARFCRHEFSFADGRIRVFSPPASLRSTFEAFAASHWAGMDPANRTDSARSTVAVSACLCGFPCRWDGENRKEPGLLEALGARENVDILAICPEVLAGFGVPRPRIQFENEDPGTLSDAPVIRNEHGEDVTATLLRAVGRISDWCGRFNVQAAFLKENSPSCGTQRIPCRGERIDAQGPLARRLDADGIRTFSEDNFKQGLEWLDTKFYALSESRGPDTGTGAGKS